MYSQSNEDEIVARYFNKYVGTMLELGCNDAKTYSNSRLLIEIGWAAHLVDASPVCCQMADKLHADNDKVEVHNCAITTTGNMGMGVLHESGAHVKGGSDYGLVSSIHKSELSRWKDVSFNEVEVHFIDFHTLYTHIEKPILDFISIDIEAEDWNVLQQINLTEVGCKCLCIEWNSIPEMTRLFTDYCAKFGLKEIHRNSENIIFAI